MKTMLILLVIILSLLFWKSFHPDYVVWSNDGPLGAMNAQQNEVPGLYYSLWADLNYLGEQAAPVSIGPSAGIRTMCWYSDYTLAIIGALVLGGVLTRTPIRKIVASVGFCWVAFIVAVFFVGFEYEALSALVSVSCFILIAVIFCIPPVQHRKESF